MKNKYLKAIIFLNIIGVILAILSFNRYITIYSKGLAEPGICNISEKVNCDIVYASSYSEILGVPAATWGLGFYASVLLIALFASLSPKNRESAASFLWLYSWVGIAATAYMFYVAQFLLHTYCIYCIGMYAVNILTTILAALTLPDMRHALKIPASFLRYSFTACVIVGITFIISNSVEADKVKRPNVDLKLVAAQHFKQPKVEFALEKRRVSSWGNPDAKIEIVEFSDFQCPFCQRAAFLVKPFLAEFKEKVRFYFVNFPLSKECNPAVQSDMHPESCLMAKAAFCAGRHEKFWKFHDEIFRRPEKYKYRVRLLELAGEAGLDKDSLDQCIDSPEASEMLTKDSNSGKSAQVHGVPAIFINGRSVIHWRYPEVIREIIREEIKRTVEQK